MSPPETNENQPHTPRSSAAAEHRPDVPSPIARVLSESPAPSPRVPTDEPGSAAAPAVKGTFREVLAFKHYRNVLLAQLVSNVGTWMELFTIQIYLTQISDKAKDQGILAFCAGVPIFLLGVFGGVVADKVERRGLLIYTQLLACVVAFAVAGVTMITWAPGDRTPIYLLWALSAINGVVMAFNFPAWQVLTPRLVPKNLLTAAITLNGIQFNLTRVVGPALAGYLLVRLSPPPLLLFNAVSFLLVAAVVWTTPKSPPPVPAPGEDAQVWPQIKAAMAFLWKMPGPRAVFLAQVTISLLAAPLVRMLSLYVVATYNLPAKTPGVAATTGAQSEAESVAGILLAVQGIGAVLGGLCLKFIPSWYPKHHFIPLAVASLGLSISIFAATTTPWGGYGVMLIVGFFWLWAFNQSWAAMQVLAPDSMRGRVMSLTTVASFGATAIGALAAGYFGDVLHEVFGVSKGFSMQCVVLALGLPLMLAGMVMLLKRTPEVDGMPRLAPGKLPRRSIVSAVLASEHRPGRPSRGV